MRNVKYSHLATGGWIVSCGNDRAVVNNFRAVTKIQAAESLAALFRKLR